MDDVIRLDDNWQVKGACVGVNPEIFFPFRPDGPDAQRARRICASCPVSPQCLAWAETAPEQYGIWAGTWPSERRALNRQRLHGGRTIEEAEVAHGTLAGARWERRRGLKPCSACRQAESDRRSQERDRVRRFRKINGRAKVAQ